MNSVLNKVSFHITLSLRLDFYDQKRVKKIDYINRKDIYRKFKLIFFIVGFYSTLILTQTKAEKINVVVGMHINGKNFKIFVTLMSIHSKQTMNITNINLYQNSKQIRVDILKYGNFK